MQVLHFGAGNIGRGFIGKTLSESGFKVIFADINQDIIKDIYNNRKYFVRTVGKNIDQVTEINNISAINIKNPKIVEKIFESDLITTAVGVKALEEIAFIIIDSIKFKYKIKSIKPLNIIACENKIKASSFLKNIVIRNLPIKYYDYLNEYIGFIDCSIDTIIPTFKKSKNNLFLIVEDFKEWIVNRLQFKGSIPKIINMELSNNLESFIERKLFTLNTGHAIAAYLGRIKKYKTIHESISDKKIYDIVKCAMQESGSVLIKLHNFNKNSHHSYIEKILLRFENPFLLDSLERIGRNPLQKLNKEERLIKPFLRCIKYKLPYLNLAKGIAAGFYYYSQNDPESKIIRNLVKQYGISKTIFQVCQLSINSKESNAILKEYHSICKIIK